MTNKVERRRTGFSWKQAGLMVMDGVLINLSMMMALQLKYDMEAPANHIAHFWNISPLMTVFTIASLYLVGLYRSLLRYVSVDTLTQITVGTLMGTVLTYLFSLAAYTISSEPNYFLMPRTVYLIHWLLLVLLIGASRFSIRVCSQMGHGGLLFMHPKGRRVLVVGAGWAGASMIRELQTGRYGDAYPVAVVDDDPAKQGTQLHRVPVLMGTENIERYAKQYKIDEIVIAIATPQGQMKPLIERCVQTKCKLKMISALQEVESGQTPIGRVRDVNINDLLGRPEQHLDMEQVRDFLKDKRILVTGGGGSIGSELCRQIMQFGPQKLILYDISENYMYDLFFELKEQYGEIVKNTVSLCVGSIRDAVRLKYVFDDCRPQIVIHAAAHKHVPLMEECPEQAVKNNVFGTYQTARCALEHGVERFVMISTDKAVNPTNVMGATKRIAEMIIQAMQAEGKTQFTAVRFGNVLGSHGSVVPLFERQIRAGGPVTLTHPDIIRYFMTIPEAASLVLQAASIAKGGELFVLDMGQPVRIQELAERMIQLYADPDGPKVEIVYTGLRPGEKLYEELLRDEENSSRTSKEKIFVAKPERHDWAAIQQMLDSLKDCLDREGDMRAALHQALPSYQEPDMVNALQQARRHEPPAQISQSA